MDTNISCRAQNRKKGRATPHLRRLHFALPATPAQRTTPEEMGYVSEQHKPRSSQRKHHHAQTHRLLCAGLTATCCCGCKAPRYASPKDKEQRRRPERRREWGATTH